MEPPKKSRSRWRRVGLWMLAITAILVAIAWTPTMKVWKFLHWSQQHHKIYHVRKALLAYHDRTGHLPPLGVVSWRVELLKDVLAVSSPTDPEMLAELEQTVRDYELCLAQGSDCDLKEVLSTTRVPPPYGTWTFRTDDQAYLFAVTDANGDWLGSLEPPSTAPLLLLLPHTTAPWWSTVDVVLTDDDIRLSDGRSIDFTDAHIYSADWESDTLIGEELPDMTYIRERLLGLRGKPMP